MDLQPKKNKNKFALLFLFFFFSLVFAFLVRGDEWACVRLESREARGSLLSMPGKSKLQL